MVSKLQVQLDEDRMAALKAYAKSKRKTMTEVVVAWIDGISGTTTADVGVGGGVGLADLLQQLVELGRDQLDLLERIAASGAGQVDVEPPSAPASVVVTDDPSGGRSDSRRSIHT